MRPIAALLLLALAASAASLDELIAAYMDFNESARALALDGNASLVLINGIPSFIAFTDAEGNASLLTEENEIRARLSAYAHAANRSPSLLLPAPAQSARLAALLLAFNASREPAESECRRLIGIDRYPCSDFESCLASCYTPICRGLALDAGPPFVHSIVDYSRALAAMDAELNAALDAIRNLPNATTPASHQLERALSSLASLRALALKSISLNPLFLATGYYFCPLPAFNYSALAEAEQEVGLARTKLLLILAPENVSAQVYAETERREGWRARLLACANNTEAAIANISAFATRFASLQRFSEIRNFTDQLEQAADKIDGSCRQHAFDASDQAFVDFALLYANATQAADALLQRLAAAEARIAAVRDAVAARASLGENATELNTTLLLITHDLDKATSSFELDAVENALATLESALSAGQPAPAGPPSSYIPERRKKSGFDWCAWVAAGAALAALAWLLLHRKR
ncbi:MAG: hypothetical protein QXG98_04735 [Candidatus Micrarchaeia archaeon]